MQDALLQLFHQHLAVSTDTRTLQPGDIYIALRGGNFDGNAFAAQALAQGAAAAIVDDPAFQGHHDSRYYWVPDTLQALQELARNRRREFDIPVIGITGSNGKTTSKELIFSVLSTETKAYATRGNLNNHIGVPLTLLGMPADTEIAIVEMGANQPGDIAELAAIAEPTHGLITNVGYAHIEKLGGLDGVRVTKGALFDFVGAHGTGIFVNAADPNVVLAAAPYPHQVTFGTPEADWHCEVIHNSLEGMTLDIYHPNWATPERFESQLSGVYNSHNILAAVAIGHTFGISTTGLKAGIYQYVPANNRSQVIRRGTRTVWMDAYNANPSSMQASIRNMFEMNPDSRTVLILGDMLEMGTQAEQVHREMGVFINQFSPLLTIGVGPLMQHMTLALQGPARWYPDALTLRSEVAVLLSDADMVLIKGSRGMALERILDQI